MLSALVFIPAHVCPGILNAGDRALIDRLSIGFTELKQSCTSDEPSIQCFGLNAFEYTLPKLLHLIAKFWAHFTIA